MLGASTEGEVFSFAWAECNCGGFRRRVRNEWCGVVSDSEEVSRMAAAVSMAGMQGVSSRCGCNSVGILEGVGIDPGSF